MSMVHGMCAVLWLASACAVAAGADTPATAATLVGGAPLHGELVSLDDNTLTVRTKSEGPSGQATRDVPLEELVVWGRRREIPSQPHALLAGRGVLVAELLRIEPHQLRFGADDSLFSSNRSIWQAATLPRGAVRAVIFEAPDGPLRRDRLADRLRLDQDELDGKDELSIDEGNSVKGRLLESPESSSPIDRFQLEVRQRAMTIAADRVRALRVAGAVPGAREARMLLGFDDGSLLLVASLAARDGTVHLTLAPAGTAQIEQDQFLESLCMVQPLHDRVAYLSDRAPAEYRHQPFLSVQRPLGRDQSVLGGLPRHGPHLFSKSLGVSSTSFVVYDIEPGWNEFAAEAALDATAEGRGSVEFRVFLQDQLGAPWQPAGERLAVRGDQPPEPLRVPLGDARRIALVVDYGERGDVLDYANWLNARLEK